MNFAPAVNAKTIELRTELNNIHNLLSNTINKKNEQALLNRMSIIDDNLQNIDQNKNEHHAKAILSGLKFNENDFDKPINEFSGGWIMRASLAKILFSKLIHKMLGLEPGCKNNICLAR